MVQGLSRPPVHDLQARAQAATIAPRRRSRFSRAARLELIDILSRWAGAGLALFAGVAIFVAVSAGRVYPFRAGAWLLLVLASLHVCRRLHRQFRSGGTSAARPFRWRANYTASLAVVSAAFGVGAIIVLPRSAPAELASGALALLIAAAIGAAAAHVAHGRAAAAASIPAAAFILVGAWRIEGFSTAASLVGAAAGLGGAALFLLNRYLRERAIRRRPRTTLVRREVSPMRAGATARAGDGRAAAL
jgi:hypothetical protein